MNINLKITTRWTNKNDELIIYKTIWQFVKISESFFDGSKPTIKHIVKLKFNWVCTNIFAFAETAFQFHVFYFLRKDSKLIDCVCIFVNTAALHGTQLLTTSRKVVYLRLRVHWMGLMSLDDSLTVSRMRYPYQTAVTVQDSIAILPSCSWTWLLLKMEQEPDTSISTHMEGLLCHCTPVIPSRLTTARQQAKQKVTLPRTAKIVSTIGWFGDV